MTCTLYTSQYRQISIEENRITLKLQYPTVHVHVG